MAEDIKPGWLSTQEMAASLGITTRAFRSWAVAPVATIGRTNYYTVGAILAFRQQAMQRKAEKAALAALEEKVAGTDGRTLAEVKFDQEVERTKLLAEQAEAQRLKNEIMRHEMAPFALITFVLGRVGNVLSGVMDALPVEVSRVATLRPQELDRVRAVISGTADSIANLADEDWVENQFEEYLKQEAPR